MKTKNFNIRNDSDKVSKLSSESIPSKQTSTSTTSKESGNLETPAMKQVRNDGTKK